MIAFLDMDVFVHMSLYDVFTSAYKHNAFTNTRLYAYAFIFIYKTCIIIYSFLLLFFYTYVGSLSNITQTRIKIKVLKRSSHRLIMV